MPTPMLDELERVYFHGTPTGRERLIVKALDETLEEMDFDRMVAAGADAGRLRKFLGLLAAWKNRP